MHRSKMELLLSDRIHFQNELAKIQQLHDISIKNDFTFFLLYPTIFHVFGQLYPILKLVVLNDKSVLPGPK